MKQGFTAYFILIIVSLFLPPPVFSQQPQQQPETITITTYYPAPFGVYQGLQLFPANAAPVECNADNEGTMYYNNTTHQLMLCQQGSLGGINWQSTGGGYWTLNTANTPNQLYLNDSAWNVGIGTNNPQSKLAVAGGAVISTNYANWNIAPNSLMVEGSVGVGTMNPQSKLGVAGAAAIGAGYAATVVAPTNGLLVEGNVGIGTNNPDANARLDVEGGNLLGAARDTAGNSLRICTGSTPETNTDWKDYGDGKNIYVDVYTGNCGFSNTPIYLSNLACSGNCWGVPGGSSPYFSINTKFRVYIYCSLSGGSCTPAQAKLWKWHINWVALGK